MSDIRRENKLDPITKRNFIVAVSNLLGAIHNCKSYLRSINQDDFDFTLNVDLSAASTEIELAENFIYFCEYQVESASLTDEEVIQLTESLKDLMTSIGLLAIDRTGKLAGQEDFHNNLKKIIKPKLIEFEHFLSQKMAELQFSSCRDLLEKAKNKYQLDDAGFKDIKIRLEYIEGVLKFFEKPPQEDKKLPEFYKIDHILKTARLVLQNLINSVPDNSYDELQQFMSDYQNEISKSQNDDVSANIVSGVIADTGLITEITHEICQEKLAILQQRIGRIEANRKLYRLVSEVIVDVKNDVVKLTENIKNNTKNKQKLSEMGREIEKLSRRIWTDEVRFNYELIRFKNISERKGLNSVFKRFSDPQNAKILRDTLAQVKDLKFRNKINRARLATALELTNNYLETPNTKNELALNEYINTLPANSHIKFYLKALIISLICTALITGVIVLSIYNPTVANLMAPVYQATGEFFANLLAAFAPMAKIISAIVTTSEQTAFVMPGIIPYIGDAPIPVWSLVAAGAVVGSVTGIKIGHVLADRKFGDKKENVKDFENAIREELSGIAEPSDQKNKSLLSGGSMFSGQPGESDGGDGYEQDPGHNFN